MKSPDTSRIDRLGLHVYCQENPLASGDAVLDEILEIVERNAGELMPVKVNGGKRKVRYSRAAIKKQFAQRGKPGDDWWLSLTKEDKPEFDLWFDFGSPSEIHFRFSLDVLPFDFYREEPLAQERTRRLVSFVRDMARRFPPWYGWGHSYTDMDMGVGENPRYGFLPKRASEVYWLNIYGKEMVDAMGRERVLSTPAAHLEELPHGGVLFLTRPTPGDFNSEDARVAQAKAVVHLNPEQSFDAVLARLRERSAALVPVAPAWDADIGGLLEYVLDFGVPLRDRPRETARFNAYRPPPVSEWMRLEEAPATDLANAAAVAEGYGVYAELLADTWAKKEVPAMAKGGPDSLIPLDCHLWQYGRKALSGCAWRALSSPG